MDGVALSTVLSTLDMRNANAESLAQVSLLKKVLQSEEEMTAALLQSLPPPNPPGTGVRLDAYA